jgi:hypothetical protein
MSILFELAQRYPQLYFVPAEGMSADERYREIVRKGKPSGGAPLGKHFTGSPEDRHFLQPTPEGGVEVVFLKNRSDFETFYRIMACRAEPVPVPKNMGAATISGITNWRKIDAHKKEYEAGGGDNWDFEFTLFTSDAANFKDVIILVSEGEYSAISSDAAGFDAKLWIEKSLTIRTYHEITHFICGKKYPDQKHAVWDEILADAIGLIFALGEYDTRLAGLFLGVSKQGYQKGGRLENYTACAGPVLDELAKDICRLMEELKKRTGEPANDEQKFALIDTWQALSGEYIARLEIHDV